MDLGSITVTGFRRFVSRTTLQTSGKLVAIVGPNEAGKSSLIDALAMLDNDDPPTSSDFSRSGDRASFSLEAKYFLSGEDLDAAGLSGPHWLSVTKRMDGNRILAITPHPPKRDTALRIQLVELFLFALNHQKFAKAIEGEPLQRLNAAWPQVGAILRSEAEDLSDSEIQHIVDFSAFLSVVLPPSLPAKVRRIPDLVSQFAQSEAALNPNEKAMRALRKRLPRIIYFDDDARNLASTYDLGGLFPDTQRCDG